MKALTLGVAAAALLAMSAGAQAQAKKYTFALVPKNMNNPFFDQARDGCKKAEAESKGAFECVYIGPGEHGGGDEQVQVVNDLIAKKVDGIAVSPSNAAAMGRALEAAKRANIRCSPGTRTCSKRTRACASPMWAPTTTTSA
jgi:ribose transport system substrate-binding protein